MKKVLLFALLIATTVLYGCTKITIENSPVSIYSVDIEALNNDKILNIIHDNSLEEGIYKITTENNLYIFFKGIKNEYLDIHSKLDNKTLILSCNSSPSLKNTNKLYVIREKNTTSSNTKNILFDKILLKVNNKEVSFSKSINLITYK